MVGGVAPSFTQMMISQVPVSAEVGAQLRTLLLCQAGAVTSGVHALSPERRRKSAYCVVAGLPPLAVAVQWRGVPAGGGRGLPGARRARGAPDQQGPPVWEGPEP